MTKIKSQEDASTTVFPNSVLFAISALVSFIYYFSNSKPQNHYDYTFRVAGNMLGGAIGFVEKPPSWLNEFVPFEGYWYSVFPLGAVLSMLPVSVLKAVGVVNAMPGGLIAALLAGGCMFFLLKIAARYDLSREKQILLSAAILFGTFAWANLTFAGAWQIALGFAMLGELGAIYFTVFDRRPLLAGFFFALAFGNRTENLLTAPVFLFLLISRKYKSADNDPPQIEAKTKPKKEAKKTVFDETLMSRIRSEWKAMALFCVVPFLLGLATLSYNYIRFHSFTDFGYARIPGVLQEPWYDHGIFSTAYIPRQAWEMLFKLWNSKPFFPYLIPDGFSSSILLSSPFLLFVFRLNPRDKVLKFAAWTAIAILTFLLWIHGNSGGWQFGYRYAMILLPWIFVILLETSPKKITPVEWAIYGFSFLANLYSVWIFHWTEYMRM